jgi:hypothetical protein
MNFKDRIAYSGRLKLIRQQAETYIQQGYSREDLHRKLDNEHEEIDARTIADLIAAVPRPENIDRFRAVGRSWQALLLLLIGLKLFFAIDLLLGVMGQPSLFGLSKALPEVSESLRVFGFIGYLLALLGIAFMYGFFGLWFSKYFNGFGICSVLWFSLFFDLISLKLISVDFILTVYSSLGLALKVFEGILLLSLFGVSLYLKRKLTPHFGVWRGVFPPMLKPVTKTDDEGRPMLG